MGIEAKLRLTCTPVHAKMAYDFAPNPALWNSRLCNCCPRWLPPRNVCRGTQRLDDVERAGRT